MATFRKSEGSAPKGRFSPGGVVSGSPFSQSQILHLMKTEFARARRYGFPVACVLIQVDRLDALVDMHGAVLREMVRESLGRLVHEKTRGADHLGLASEDRFLVVMPHTSGGQAMHVADRLRASFAALDFRVGSNELGLHLSIGVASCDDQATLFFDTMLTQCEAALEHASACGGNQCALFHHEQIRGIEDISEAELLGDGSRGPSPDATEAPNPDASDPSAQDEA